MQASLESESTRQKRQQEYGYDARSGSKAVSVEAKGALKGCAEGLRGVRSKGKKKDKYESSLHMEEDETDDGEWTIGGSRRVKATYKRRGGTRRVQRRCSQAKQSAKDGAHDDAMDVDDLPEREVISTCSTKVEDDADAPKRYTLRNRQTLRKPPKSLLETLADPQSSCAPRKRRSQTSSKKKKSKEEDAWWESANAVRIKSVRLAHLTPVPWQQAVPL